MAINYPLEKEGIYPWTTQSPYANTSVGSPVDLATNTGQQPLTIPIYYKGDSQQPQTSNTLSNLGNIAKTGLTLYDYWKSQDDARDISKNWTNALDQGMGEIRRYTDPYSFAGLPGVEKYNKLLMDPSSVVNTPGYQFNLDEQNRALERSAAAKSGILSGENLTNLARYTSGYASSQYDAELNRAKGLVGIGAESSQAASLAIAELFKERGGATAMREALQGENRDSTIRDIVDIVGSVGGTLQDVDKILESLGVSGGLESIYGSAKGALGALGIGGAAAATGATAYAAPGLMGSVGLEQAMNAPLTPLGPNDPWVTGGIQGTDYLGAPTGPVGTTLSAIGGGLVGNKLGDIMGQGTSSKAGATVGGAVGGGLGASLGGPVGGAIGSMIGGTLGGMVGNIFSGITGIGGKDKPDFDFLTSTGTGGQFSKGNYVSTPFGNIGFNSATTRDLGSKVGKEKLQEYLGDVIRVENEFAKVMTPEELNKVKSSLNGKQLGNMHMSNNPAAELMKQHMTALKNSMSPERLKASGIQTWIDDYNRSISQRYDLQTQIDRYNQGLEYGFGGEAPLTMDKYMKIYDQVKGTKWESAGKYSMITNPSKYLI